MLKFDEYIIFLIFLFFIGNIHSSLLNFWEPLNQEQKETA